VGAGRDAGTMAGGRRPDGPVGSARDQVRKRSR
jgi:hypothetical protein